jgi:hypothetical protein
LSLAGLLPLAWAVVLVLFIVPLVLAQEWVVCRPLLEGGLLREAGYEGWPLVCNLHRWIMFRKGTGKLFKLTASKETIPYSIYCTSVSRWRKHNCGAV